MKTPSDPSNPPERRDITAHRIAAGTPRIDGFTYCVVEPAQGEGPHDERRGERRLRTRLRDGLLTERRGRVLVECRIRDRSKRGARLRLDKDRPLPRVFLLTDASSRMRFWATLVWQSGRDAGVRLMVLDER